MRIRPQDSSVYRCSECNAFFPKYIDNCKKCGAPDQAQAYKLLDNDSAIGKSNCQLCGAIALESLNSCSSPSCNAIFIGSKKECPLCNEISELDTKVCKCGFDFNVDKTKQNISKIFPSDVKNIDDNKEDGFEKVSSIKVKQQNDKNKMGTKWLSFINYFSLPLAIFIVLYEIIFNGYFNFNSIIILTICIPLAIGIHKKKSYSFILYNIYAIIAPAIGVYENINTKAILRESLDIYMTNAEFASQFLIGYTLFFTIFSLPNLIYINKRKFIFIEEIQIKDIPEKPKEDSSEIEVEIPKENISNFDPFESIEKLSKLKNNGSITDEEFQEKKKELLKRV